MTIPCISFITCTYYCLPLLSIPAAVKISMSHVHLAMLHRSATTINSYLWMVSVDDWEGVLYG